MLPDPKLPANPAPPPANEWSDFDGLDWGFPTEVHPMIQLGQDTFRRELPQLLKTHYRQWVIYHGDRRLGFGRSKTKLLREWIAGGIPRMELVVMCVEPTIPYEEG